MIQGYFSFKAQVENENIAKKIIFNFGNGFVKFSDYFLQLNNTSVNFLVRRKNTDFFQEVINKERIDEMLAFSSILSLFNDLSFKERLKRETAVYIVYDELFNEVSIIRDTFGTVPLFYALSLNGFIFSTDLKYILNHKDFNGSHIISNASIISYLTWLNNGSPHSNETFYTNIKTVLPGHFVLASKDGLISKPLVSFSPNKWDHLTRMEEFGEEFRSLFRISVSNCIQNRSNVSSHLSGGMDSSSVSSMIKHISPDLKLNTLYAETNTKLTNESEYAARVASDIHSNHVIVHPSTNELDLLVKNTSLYGSPEYMSITPALQTELIKTAGNLHSQILLTGTDGDSIVGHGMNHLNDLFSQRSWDLLKIALSELAVSRSGIVLNENWSNFTLSQKKAYIFRDFFYSKLSASPSISHAISLANIANTKFNVGYSDLIKKGFKGLRNKINNLNKLPSGILASHISLERTNPSTTFSPYSLIGALPDKYLFSFKDVFYTQGMAINEEKFYLARDNNIEIGYPFYNTELFELNLAVPNIIKYNQGKGRGHFKEAMKGIVIEEVINRTDKGIFSDYGRKAALNLYYQSRDFLTDSNKVWDYVDKSSFSKSLKLFLSSEQPSYIHNKTRFFVTRTIYLSIWLNS